MASPTNGFKAGRNSNFAQEITACCTNLTPSLAIFIYIMSGIAGRFTNKLDLDRLARSSTQQQVNNRNLSDTNRCNGCPRYPFAQAQAALASFTQPELHFERTDFDRVAVAQ